MGTNITITRDEAKQIRRGVDTVFEGLKDAKAVKILIEESQKTLDNSSAKSIVDFANGQMGNFTEGYEKLCNLTSAHISVLLDGMKRASSSIEDDATVKELEGTMQHIEDSNAEVKKTLAVLGDTQLKASEDADKPISYSDLLALVDSFKAIPKGLGENLDAIEEFKKSVEKTDYAGSNEQCKDNLKTLVNGFADQVNDNILPIAEGYAGNVITFIEEHKANLNKENLAALEESKAIMAKFGAEFGENISSAKKNKVAFKAPKRL